MVKVVTDLEGYAHYFSRAAIPFTREISERGQANFGKRHIGIYAYRVETLNRYVKWSQVPLEVAERLEQLRAMGHGVRIHMQEAVEKMPAGVDTQEDLDAVRAILEAGTK